MKPTELTYKVKTKNGLERLLRFTESYSKGDYGNGIYIGVETVEGDLTILDMRYAKDYNFQRACQDYISRYYGENLAGFERIGMVFGEEHR